MAKRNNNHIIGDEAVNAIKASLIPQEWITNPQTSDYGLDMLVEIVKANETTGKMFFIQAKGTDTLSNSGTIHFPFPIERLRDYTSVPLPVLLVVYSCRENLFWGKWINSLYCLLSPEQQAQKFFSIELTPNNIIDRDYLRSHSDHFTDILPSGVCVQAQSCSPESCKIHKQILSKAGRLFSTSITDSNRLACMNISIEYSFDQNNVSAIIQDKYGHLFHFSGPLEDKAILYYNTISDSDCPDIMWDILLSIAYFERNLNWAEAFMIITRHLTPTFFSSLSDADWLSFIHDTPRERLNHLDRFLGLCVEAGRVELLSLSLLYVFTASNGDYNLTRPYLYQVYTNESDTEKKGLLAYNIANSLRTTNLDAMHDAASWYFIAIHSFPAYRKLEYWWQEMGSVLHNTGHYFFAEHFYKKARSISRERCYPEISLLIADCLVQQLKLADAQDEINTFIAEKRKNKEDVKSSIILKSKAISLFKEIVSVISFDPLSTIDWFNSGVNMFHNNCFKEALSYFLIAWLINDSDKESLANTLFCAWNIKETSITCDALWAIKELYGDDGYNMIVSTILKQKDMPEQIRDQFIDSFRDIVSEYDVPQIESHNLVASYDGWGPFQPPNDSDTID